MLLRTLLLLLTGALLGAPLAAQFVETRGERDRRGYRQLKNRLSRQAISVDWGEDVSLREALRELRVRARVNLVVGSELYRGDLGDEPVDLKLRDVAVWDLLTLLADRHGLGFRMRGRLLVVSTKADTIRRSMRLVIHDARLVGYRPPDFPGPRMGLRPSGLEEERPEVEPRESVDREAIVESIRSLTGEKNWEIEGASIQFLGGRLVVRHAPSMQREVARVLALLR